MWLALVLAHDEADKDGVVLPLGVSEALVVSDLVIRGVSDGDADAESDMDDEMDATGAEREGDRVADGDCEAQSVGDELVLKLPQADTDSGAVALSLGVREAQAVDDADTARTVMDGEPDADCEEESDAETSGEREGDGVVDCVSDAQPVGERLALALAPDDADRDVVALPLSVGVVHAVGDAVGRVEMDGELDVESDSVVDAERDDEADSDAVASALAEADGHIDTLLLADARGEMETEGHSDGVGV